MNLQGTLRVPLASGLQEQRGEMKNNNRQALFTPEGDANANQIQVGDGGLTVDVGTLPPLVSHSGDQDKLIIWGTDSPCEDPDLEEFELLECQELEAFLVEEEEVYKQEIVGGTEVVKSPLPFDKPRPASCVSAPVETAKGKENGQGTGEGRTTWQGGRDSEAAVSYPGRVGGQFRSENDIFVSCLSAVPSLRGSLGSALDNAGRGSATDSWHIPSYPQGATPEDQATPPATSAKSGRGVDENLNSTTLSQGLRPQAQPEQKGLPQGSSGALTNGSRKSQGREEGHSGQNESEEVKRQRNSMFTGQSMARPGPEVQPRRWTCPSLVADYKTGLKTTVKYSQKGEASEINSNHLPSNAGPGATPNLTAAKEPRAPQKQGSVERVRDRSASPSSLERRAQMGQRRPWGSPTRPPTPGSPKSTGSPRKVAPTSPAKSIGARSSLQENSSDLRAPGKVCMGSGIPKPLLQHLSRAAERAEQQERKSEKSPPPKCPPKPKNVRPKIITYIRKSPQVKPQVAGGPYEASTLPPRLSAYTSPPAGKDPKADGDPKTSPVLSASNLLYDKYRQEMQRARLLSSGLAMSGIRPPSHTHTVPHKLSGKSDGFSGGMEMARGGGSLGGAGRGENLAQQLAPHAAANLFQPPRALRPQLGVGAVNRQPFNKNRMFLTGQKPALTPTQPVQAVSPTVHCYQEPSGDQRKTAPTPAPKSFLPKPGQSGLRPPGYSRLPAARLAAFGFVRSGSVSSVSSNQSNDSTRSDPCRPMYRPSSVIDDPPPHRVTAHTSDTPRAPSRGSPLPPNTPAPIRRALVPPARGSPVASRKEIQKDVEVARPAVSSPKRCAVVSPKPQSPVHMRQKPTAARNSMAGGAPRADGVQVARDTEQVAIQKLRERCEEQAKQLLALQAELRKATLGLDVFAISTQNFSQKSDAAVDRERELSLELSKIRDEVAFNATRWERLQREKEELEQSFERELKDLQAQQEAELGALEEGLRVRHEAERENLQAEHQAQLDELRTQQQEQIEEMAISHETAMKEIRNVHSMTMATLQKDHAVTVRDLRRAHEEQRKTLEEEFEKMRLSLQDQVDTLTFQNRTLRDRAKRFEEALRKSADEQIEDALAPYQHIQEDLKSLKEILEMKNQQIHEQEKKISELEKMAQKNVLLEERVQVLQQQNEDLKARIDANLSLSRQLSEENANLQEYVEKETNEKKRLSRNNEELLWRLQTGELSPRMSPCSSPLHRASPGPASPSRLQPFPH